jgi:hypothetical protein
VAIKIKLGELTIEADTQDDLRTVLVALGRSEVLGASTNGHTNGAAKPPPPEPERPDEARRASPLTAPMQPAPMRTPAPRPAPAAQSLVPNSALPVEARLDLLVSQASPKQLRLLTLLLKFPDGLSDAEARDFLQCDQPQLGGMLMSISKAAGRLHLDFDSHVIDRRITRSGRERSYYYRLRSGMRAALQDAHVGV